MIRMLSLLLPALFPSWRFFDRITAAPRIEVTGPGTGWRPLRPRPDRIGCRTTLIRLFFNPQGNEDLFLTALAERALAGPDPKAEAEILRHVQAAGAARFRIVLIDRTGREVALEQAP